MRVPSTLRRYRVHRFRATAGTPRFAHFGLLIAFERRLGATIERAGDSQKLIAYWRTRSHDGCARLDDGNPTFTTGSRRDLLNLLAKWRTEPLPQLPPRQPR